MSNIRVLQLTDLHLTASAGERLLDVDTQQSLERVLQRAFASGAPDLVMLTGDIAHDPRPPVYQRAIETLQRYGRVPWLWTPGNHDLGAPMRDALTRLGRTDTDAREAVIGEWAFHMVDTHTDEQTGGRVSEDELALLDAFLGATTTTNIVIAGHHPLTPVGTAWLDTDRVTNADLVLQRLVSDGRVRVFLCGHVHQRHESWHDGVRLLTTPSTCFQFPPGSESFTTDDSPPGWRWLDLASDGTIRTNVEWAIA